MKSKLFVSIAALVFASLALTACGSGAPMPAPTLPVQAPTLPVQAPTEVPSTQAAATCPVPVDMKSLQAPASPKIVTVSFTQEPTDVVTEFAWMQYAGYLSQMAAAGLANWNDKAEYVPQLAAEIPSVANGGISTDGLTITWHLKPCLYWSDGQPLTSKDVLFTWKAITDPKNTPSSRNGYNKISSIDTPDDQTAVLHFSQLFPAWQTLFVATSAINGMLLPAHILEGHTQLEKDPFIHNPNVSAGPFVITEWVAGDHMRLAANPNYYLGKAKLDEIDIKFVPDPETALAALKSGDIDISPDFSIGDVSTLQKMAPVVQVSVIPGSLQENFYPNYGTTAGIKLADGTVVGKSEIDGPCPLQDVRVRKAITLGINRQAIVDNLLFGLTSIPTSEWPNSVWDNTSLKPEPYDPAQANQLLDSAGYKPGADGIRTGTCNGKQAKLSFSLSTTNKQLRIDESTVMQADLLKIGVELTPDLAPGGTVFATFADGGPLATGKFDLGGGLNGFAPDPDPGDTFSCSGDPNKGNPAGDNWTHLCDPKLDELVAQTTKSADPVVRKQAFDALEQYMYDQSYILYLYNFPDVVAYSSRLAFPPFSDFSGWAWNAFQWDVK